jgi:hypothetical protein
VKVTYTGHRTLWYPDYIDLATGKTLAVEPGGTYSIEAVGYNAPDYPADGFTPGKQEDPDGGFAGADQAARTEEDLEYTSDE